MMVISISKNK